MEDKNNDKTQQYKIKTTQKPDKKTMKKQRKKHPKLKKFIIINFILLVILCLTGIGVFCGIFFSDEWEITKEDLVITHENTEVYDINNKKIGELTGDESRKIITLSEMGEYLPNAFVAIEDERYYEHFGIDIKRTAGAIVTYILNGGQSSFGGSTITQQLVKNMLEDNADSGIEGIERKIREWSRACQLEEMLSKSQILELYLNKIFMGSTVYGVESGSQYYFSKSAKDLSLAEAAFIAGINHSPNSYNPFEKDTDNSEIIKERTKTVLAKMQELQNTDVPELQGLTKITDEDYEKAFAEVDKGLKFKKGEIGDNSNISFHTAAALDQVTNQYAKEKGINYDTARDLIRNSGYKLYTTQDSDIQKIMEEEYKKDKYIHDSLEEGKHSQSAMTVIDYRKGYVVGCVGGLGEDSSPLGQNRATQSDDLQVGSSMKPLAAIAPGLEEGVITAATMYDDSDTSFGGEYYENSTGYQGIISVRGGITCSSNIVNMKILSNVGPYTAVGYLNEFGLTNYDEQDASLSLTLGGTLHGASPTQMAAAYGTLANGGVYVEPTFYLKLEDSNGETILEPTQETRRVVSEQTAYITTNILKSPVEGFDGLHATATNCKVSGMETAAKTGTTSEFKDRWLCGMTPYYSAATWYGYDEPETIYETVDGYDNPSSVIWDSVMNQIHEDLEPANFEVPDGIVYAKICGETGRVATKKCKDTFTEIFASGTVPGECGGHEAVKICKETKLLATEYCPETEEKVYPIMPEKEQNASWYTDNKKYKEIKDTCKKHTAETMKIKVPNVVGLTEDEAREQLKDFSILTIYDSDPSKENGIVLEQSIEPEKLVDKKTPITITINQVEEVEPPLDNNTIEEPPPIEGNEIEGNEIEGGENEDPEIPENEIEEPPIEETNSI